MVLYDSLLCVFQKQTNQFNGMNVLHLFGNMLQSLQVTFSYLTETENLGQGVMLFLSTKTNIKLEVGSL